MGNRCTFYDENVHLFLSVHQKIKNDKAMPPKFTARWIAGAGFRSAQFYFTNAWAQVLRLGREMLSELNTTSGTRIVETKCAPVVDPQGAKLNAFSSVAAEGTGRRLSIVFSD